MIWIWIFGLACFAVFIDAVYRAPLWPDDVDDEWKGHS